jgi:hypothetical protein
MMDSERGLLQHLGGIFDSSVEACAMRTRRQLSQ